MPVIDTKDAFHADEFRYRVVYFLIKASIAVLGEDPSGMAVGEHDARVAYARGILGVGDASYNLDAAIGAVLTNTTVAANGVNTTDGDLEFTVNSMYSDLAGFDPPAV